MILTPLDRASLPEALERFAAALRDPGARALFARLARVEDAERATGAIAEAHHRAAVALAGSFGMGMQSGSPALDFSWDGQRLRTEIEAYILVHEVAHYQLAAPARRTVIDFGLGAGPETGNRDAAERAAVLLGVARESEEALASLLGVVWEVELGQPGLASFLDQNWLEGAGRPSTAAYFEATVRALRDAGFLDAALRPMRRLRCHSDGTASADGAATAQESALRGPA
jgi:hypothetical protein